jgi:hypothetical protein
MDNRTKLTITIPNDLKESFTKIRNLTGKSITSQLIEGGWMWEREFMKQVENQNQNRHRVMNLV